MEDQSHAVWLQTSFYIKTTYNSGDGGEDPALGLAQQDSFINVALGGVDPKTGGLIGARRGGSQLDVLVNDNCEGDCTSTKRDALAFNGDLASVASPSGDRISSARRTRTL